MDTPITVTVVLPTGQVAYEGNLQPPLAITLDPSGFLHVGVCTLNVKMPFTIHIGQTKRDG